MAPRRGDSGPQPQPRSPPGAEGAVAWLIRHESGWGRQRWPAGRCRTALRAAQLRLVLGFFQSERLAAHCPLELDVDISGTIAAYFRVSVPAPPLP